MSSTSQSSASLSSGSTLSSQSSSQSSSSSSTAREFQPTDLAGTQELHPFYDLRRYTYVDASGFGEPVSAVAALDGNSFTVSPANPPLRGTFNGRAGIRCVGNDRAVFTPSIPSSDDSVMFFIGLRLDNHFKQNNGDTNVVFLYQTDQTNSEGFSISFDDSDQTYVIAFGPLSEGIRIPQRMLAGEVLLTVHGDIGGNVVSVWINGNLIATSATTQSELGSDANEASFGAGASGDNTIGFFAAFNTTLSASRRQDVEKWLLDRVTSGTATTGRFGGRGYALNADHKWDHGDNADGIESSGSSSSSGSSRSVSSSTNSTGTSSTSSASPSSSSTINLSTSSPSSSLSSSSASTNSSSSTENSSSSQSTSTASSSSSASTSSSSSKNSSSST